MHNRHMLVYVSYERTRLKICRLQDRVLRNFN